MEARIAIIDDEPELLQLLCDMLQVAGFSVVPVSSPGATRLLDRAAAPDLFLIDVMLPGMSGIELAEQLRAAGFARTPMIAMSASKRMVRLAMDSGLFQATIAKPFDVPTVVACIRHTMVAHGAAERLPLTAGSRTA